MSETKTQNMLPATNDRREARRRAMMEAALELFLERGYGAVGVNEVVKRSGGSLSTFYDLFGNKTGLFREIVEEKCRTITAIFQDPQIDDKPPREALTALAHSLFTVVMAPDSIAAIRAIIAEGQDHPELGQLFFEHGPDAGQRRTASYLAEQTRKGVLKVDDPDRAASHFCSLVRGEYHLRAVCGTLRDGDRDDFAAHLDDCVARFLAAYAP